MQLESEMKEQLRGVFEKLDSPVFLEIDETSHSDASSLQTFLNDLASCSSRIEVKSSGQKSPVPSFAVRLASRGGEAPIRFVGIPGGHEFTSLILAILNSNLKGKLPDEGIQGRIRNLKGPIRLRTFVSLTCENCPDVVQSLNLMAVLHADFQHQMVEGGTVPEEVERLGIQGVPSVIVDFPGQPSQMIHSGKIQLLDLLVKLEEFFGKKESGVQAKDLGQFDVVVIGGGPAGASAAIYSVRKGLKTALIAERFGGQLRETLGIENMISIPYTEGSKLATQLREHVQSYPIQIFEHRRVTQISGGAIKKIEIDGGEFLQTSTVILATGAKWRELGIPGEKEHIGQGVAFCAHCDGPFYKGKKVAVVGGGNSGVEAAIDLSAIASHVTLLEFSDKLKADEVLVKKLTDTPNAKIITQAKSSQVIGRGGKVVALEYQDRPSQKLEQIETDGVFVQIGLLPNTQFVKGLVELTPYGEIVVDAKGRTSVPGIYAAGDVTTIPFKQIVLAMGDGAKAALTAFEDRLRSKG